MATPTPTVPVVPRKDVTFTTADHIKLTGWLYGSGTNVIVLSLVPTSGKSS
ncbi:hypothetical protein KDW_53920 [Dictyobacter vulcani]|uniref:Uncharacterized protein n=1 Tax=Dictyobacter vulcani TaxID=2607529 RepID=A0A5J4KXF4_9CHLR|nr:hypothetical protein KDW_53920 [Dictyobacter vulcani]